MAPELIMKKIQGKPADIWSVGCVVIEMLTGIPPWSNITQDTQEVYKLISNGGIYNLLVIFIYQNISSTNVSL